MSSTIRPIKEIILIILLTLIIPANSYSQKYRGTQLVHPDGRFYTSGLNNYGQVCGTVLVDEINFINHAVRYEPDGTFTTFTLGENGNSATASEINEYGHVIGTINTTDFTSRVGIWESDTSFRELSQPEGFIVITPKDLNNRGEAVGYTLTTDPKAYFWDAEGNYHELPQRGYGAEAVALNDSSQIGGRIFDDQGNSILALWQPVEGKGADEQVFELVELGEPAPDARINDISNAIFPYSPKDSTAKSREFDPRFRAALVGGFMDSWSGGARFAFTASTEDRIIQQIDISEFDSEVLNISGDGTVQGYKKNRLGGYDGTVWENIGYDTPSFKGVNLNSAGDGTIIGEAMAGNASGMILGSGFTGTMVFLNDKIFINQLSDGLNVEPGNSNLASPEFIISGDFGNVVASIASPYDEVKFDGSPDGGTLVSTWNGENGPALRLYMPGTIVTQSFITEEEANILLSPFLNMEITGNGSFKGEIDGGGNDLIFNVPDGQTGQYYLEDRWFFNGNFRVSGRGNHMFETEEEEILFPPAAFGNGEGLTEVTITRRLPEVENSTLTMQGMSIHEATVDISGFDVVRTTGPSSITGGDLTADNDFYLEDKWEVKSGSLFTPRLFGEPNSSLAVEEEGSLQGKYFDFKGLALDISGAFKFQTLEYSNKDSIQEITIFDPDSVSVKHFFSNNFRTILRGTFQMDSLTISGIIEAGGPEAVMRITNRNPETFLADENSSDSGPVTAPGFSEFPGFTETAMERAVQPVTRSGSDNYSYDAFFFTTGEDGKIRPVIVQPEQSGPFGDPMLRVRAINPAEENITQPGEFPGFEDFEFQNIEGDHGWIFRTFNQNPLKSSGNEDAFIANIRIPVYGMESITDLDQYRLLLYDCEGNFLGPAGDFMASGSEPQSSVLYTGNIDGVFNITHTDVLLDTCQYIVLASGEASTAVNDPFAHEGFMLRQNHPNPFSLNTHISYTLSGPAQVNLSVYNMLGQQVRNLVMDKQTQGDYTVDWDGRDDSGKLLAGGVYFCRLVINHQGTGLGDVLLSRKMLLR